MSLLSKTADDIRAGFAKKIGETLALTAIGLFATIYWGLQAARSRPLWPPDIITVAIGVAVATAVVVAAVMAWRRRSGDQRPALSERGMELVAQWESLNEYERAIIGALGESDEGHVMLANLNYNWTVLVGSKEFSDKLGPRLGLAYRMAVLHLVEVGFLGPANQGLHPLLPKGFNLVEYIREREDQVSSHAWIGALEHAVENPPVDPGTPGSAASAPAEAPKPEQRSAAEMHTLWSGLNDYQKEVLRAFASETATSAHLIYLHPTGWLVKIGKIRFGDKGDPRENPSWYTAVHSLHEIGIFVQKPSRQGESFSLTGLGGALLDVVQQERSKDLPPTKYPEITKEALIEKALAARGYYISVLPITHGRPRPVLQVDGEVLERKDDPLYAEMWMAVFAELKQERIVEPQGRGLWRLSTGFVVRAQQNRKTT